LSSIDEIVLSLYARGLTTGDSAPQGCRLRSGSCGRARDRASFRAATWRASRQLVRRPGAIRGRRVRHAVVVVAKHALEHPLRAVAEARCGIREDGRRARELEAWRLDHGPSDRRMRNVHEVAARRAADRRRPRGSCRRRSPEHPRRAGGTRAPPSRDPRAPWHNAGRPRARAARERTERAPVAVVARRDREMVAGHDLVLTIARAYFQRMACPIRCISS
jgi:hypothetical protein